MEKKNEKEPQDKTLGIPVKALDWLAYGSSTAVGLIQGKSAINEAIYEQNKGLHEIQILRKNRDDNIASEAIAKSAMPRESARAIRGIQKNYEEAVSGTLKQYGLKDTRDYWNALTDTNRNKVIFERILTPAGIVLGAMLAIANIGSIRKLFSDENKNNVQR